MKTLKQIKSILKKNRYINSYFNESTQEEILQRSSILIEKSRKFSGFLEKYKLDVLPLTFLAEVLRRRRNEDIALMTHSRNEKYGYEGANEFLKLLNDYTDGKIAISSIRFDFKRLINNQGKNKSKNELKSESAISLSISSHKMIRGLLFSLLHGHAKEKVSVYASYLNLPLFKENKYPYRKAEFIRKHNRIATKELIKLLNTYKKIPLKEKKLIAMKVLVLIRFLDSYEIYKKRAQDKMVKKILAENEYYLQRYNEFTRIR